MTTFRKSVPKPANGSGAPRGKNPMLKVIYVADLAVFPQSDENSVKTTGNIIMKADKYPIDFYATDDNQKASHSLDGEADAEGFLKKLEASHPGDELAVNEFLQNSLGEGFIILYPIDCEGNVHKIIGTKCNPLYIKGSDFTDDKDGVKHVITFEQRRRDSLVAKVYDGSVPSMPVANPVGFTVAVTDASGPVYQLPASTTINTVIGMTLSGSSAGLYNKIITLIGGGGTNPAAILSDEAESGAQILLKDGVTWTALQGAKINFRVLYTPGSANNYHLVEISRS